MSTEEQDLMLGRAMREKKESETSVRALEAKLSSFSEFFNKLALTLNGTWNPKPNPVTAIDDAISAVRRLPDPDSIVQALNELRTERDRFKQAQSQLERLGG
jgi:hypothetical protein